MQSHVPEHTQLGWIMECTASLGELQRMTQFKDKSAKQSGDFISAGLLTYPALQAADILLYDANYVPVGDDQRQHIELTRDLAIRFNHRYGDTFVVPEAAIPPAGARVMDLQDPTRKMSKSTDSPQGTVLVLDPPEVILRKFKRAVTDSGTEVATTRAAKPGVSNLLSILAAATGTTPQAAAEGFTQYGPLKQATAEAVSSCCARCRSATPSWPPTRARWPGCWPSAPTRPATWPPRRWNGPSATSASCRLAEPPPASHRSGHRARRSAGGVWRLGATRTVRCGRRRPGRLAPARGVGACGRPGRR